MTREEFDEICDQFRPKHIWEKKSNRWELKKPLEYFSQNKDKRIISRLDIKNNFLVKGINLEGLRVLGFQKVLQKNITLKILTNYFKM